MIKFENTEIIGWEAAIRGMRNPMNSWEMSDSGKIYWDGTWYTGDSVIRSYFTDYGINLRIGPNDLDLMKRLRNAGTDHRKFMRLITVYCDITAPLYWWKEFDTYKVGTVANSCSTMHKIHAKEFTLEDFSCENLDDEIGCYVVSTGDSFMDFDFSSEDVLNVIISALNFWRNKYLIACKTESETGLSAKYIWWQMIQLLPSSYNQKRTVMLNYEVLANMYHSRKSHKLDEWRDMCSWIESLPYAELIVGEPELPLSPLLKRGNNN